MINRVSKVVVVVVVIVFNIIPILLLVKVSPYNLLTYLQYKLSVHQVVHLTLI
jgi:hypothetical protein